MEPVVEGEELARLIALARAAWPGIEVAPERFAAYLEARLDPDRPDPVAGLHASDLWLACACFDRQPEAITLFERAFGSDLAAALLAARIPPDVADDARQVVWTKLFVPGSDGEPVIGRYGGRGELRAWVRATAVRSAIDLLRRGARERPTAEVPDDPLPPVDPELARLRAAYGAEFKAAFAAAVEALPPRDRTLLRQRYVDDLDIDALGAIHQVHRATAARWLQRIRGDLVLATRARLADRIGGEDVSSVLRFVGSMLELSLAPILKK